MQSTISKDPAPNKSCSLLLLLLSEVMLKLVILIISVLFALVSQAHDFYFAFAEVAYDEITERIQVTVVVTTHDLEKSMLVHGNEIHISAASTSDSSVFSLIEKKLNKGLFFISGNERSMLKLDGYEPQLNGTTLFYLSCGLKTQGELLVHFPLLMDVFPEQQNKITWMYRGEKETYIFLPMMNSQLISLTHENEK